MQIIRSFYTCPKINDTLSNLLNTFVSYPPFFEDCLLDPQTNKDLYFCFDGASIAQKAIFNGLVNLIYNRMRITKRQLRRAIYKDYKNNQFSFLIDRELDRLQFGSVVDRADGFGVSVRGRPEVFLIKRLCRYRTLSDLVDCYNEVTNENGRG
jgi:hypothetical protein